MANKVQEILNLQGSLRKQYDGIQKLTNRIGHDGAKGELKTEDLSQLASRAYALRLQLEMFEHLANVKLVESKRGSK